MRRLVSLVSIVVLGSLGTVGLQPPAHAQEATPVTEMVMEGITVEDLAASEAPAFPPGPVDVALVRLRFAPGGRLVAPRTDDLGVALIYVEGGTITTRSTDPLLVMRGAQTPEQVPAETDVRLEAGDSVFAAPGSGGAFHNEGTGEASLLFTLLTPVMAATPTP
jgi:hypothetical protein